MSVMTVIKKIGDTIVSVVEYPFKHSIMLAKLLHDVEKDTPATAAALVGLVKQFEVLGPDLVAAIAAKGFDLPDDLKVCGEVKSLFAYFQATVLPAIEQESADLNADLGTAPANAASADPAPANSAATPGLAAVTPA